MAETAPDEIEPETMRCSVLLTLTSPTTRVARQECLLDRPEPLVRDTQSINKGLPTQRSIRHRKLAEQEV